MKLPFKKQEFLGNIRSGNRRENNAPRNLNHFDVHQDSYTSNYSIELFNELFKEKPAALKIKPVLYKVTYDIYTKDIKCMGENGIATRIIGKGQRQECKCEQEECNYCKSNKCTRTGKLYFRLAGIEEKGIWCYSTKSKGIDNIDNYLKLKKDQGIDIENSYFLLELHEKNGASGKVYVPDIKIIEENKNTNGVNSNKSNENNANTEKKPILYEYVKGSWANYCNQKVPMLILKNQDGKESPVYILKNSNKEILKLSLGTVITIKKFSKDKNNMILLEDYKIIKAVEKKKIEENKKAV